MSALSHFDDPLDSAHEHDARCEARIPLLVRTSCCRLVLSATFALLFAGCSSDDGIREYVVEPDNDRIFTSDVLKDEFGSIPFEWDVPESWALAENDQFSKIAWHTGSEGQEARITLSDLPIEAGLVPQLTRWRRQIAIEQSPQDNPLENTERLELDGAAATYVDFKGPEATILGLLVPLENKLWVLKFRGNNTLADEQRATFRQFCESMKVP